MCVGGGAQLHALGFINAIQNFCTPPDAAAIHQVGTEHICDGKKTVNTHFEKKLQISFNVASNATIDKYRSNFEQNMRPK